MFSDGFVTAADLFQAYRKAKADAFFERTNQVALRFAQYEANLVDNLTSLLAEINSKKPTWFEDPDFVGGHAFIPKSLEVSAKQGEHDDFFFLDSRDASRWPRTWQAKSKASAGSEARFRVVGDLKVAFHVVSALWLLKVGNVFDSCLTDSAYGSRLRTVRWGARAGELERRALGSFRPYHKDFRGWRGKAFSSIRKELEDGRRVVAMTLDFQAFYHRVAPAFLLRPEYLQAARIHLSGDQKRFTQQLVQAITTWAKTTPEHADNPHVGLPIGLSASKVIANAILVGFDRGIRRIKPIYYGRYVDDILLVFPDRASFKDGQDVWRYLAKETEGLFSIERDEAVINVRLAYAKDSALRFIGKKQRIFSLQGQPGKDLLKVIQDEIRQQASEWRLFPELPEDESEWFKDVVAPSDDSSVTVDNLRKAEVLTVRSQRFSVVLRNLERIQRQLNSREWRRQRSQFFDFVCTHIVTPRAFFDYSGFVTRIAALAFASQDYLAAISLIRKTNRTLHVLEQNTNTIFNGREFQSYRRYLGHGLAQALVQATAAQPISVNWTKRVLRQIGELERRESRRTVDQVVRLGARLFEADLARDSYRQLVLHPNSYREFEHRRSLRLPPLDSEVRKELRLRVIRAFIRRLKKARPKLEISEIPLIFATRPFKVGELTMLMPDLLQTPLRFKSMSRAVRGTAPLDIVTATNGGRGGVWTVTVHSKADGRQPVVAIPCLLTEEKSWRAAARGKPDESYARLARLNALLNAILRGPEIPNYVVLPELAVPRRWIDTIAYILSKNGVNLIAGVEYEHLRKTGVINQVQISIAIGKPGYTSQIVLVQEKQSASRDEGEDLASLGKSLTTREIPPRKYLVQNRDLHFGVLICSELTDVRSRLRYRGQVDALFVVEWNRDINSFSSLVEASAIDIHCYVVQANNRLYGDCRVRVPGKKEWTRDPVRIKGGIADYYALGVLSVEELRRFQSVQPSPDEPFKPTPDGFNVSAARQTIGT